MNGLLPLKESFDVAERDFVIGGCEAYFYSIDGFAKYKLPYIKAEVISKIEDVVTAVLSGQTALLIEGYDSIIVMDLREFPVRSVTEPEKGKKPAGRSGWPGRDLGI